MEMLGVDIAQSTQPKEPLIGVEPIERKGRELLAVHRRHILEPVAQPKGAVVTEVVAQEHVVRRGLRRRCLEGWVGIQEGHHGRPTVVRDSMHSHPAVVVRQVFHEPIDRVVCVRRLVDARGIARLSGRTNHREGAFGSVLAPNILADDQILIADQGRIALQFTPAGRLGIVRRPHQENRQWRRRRPGTPDHGIQFDPIAHRDCRPTVLIVGGRTLDRKKRNEDREYHGVTTDTSR